MDPIKKRERRDMRNRMRSSESALLYLDERRRLARNRQATSLCWRGGRAFSNDEQIALSVMGIPIHALHGELCPFGVYTNALLRFADNSGWWRFDDDLAEQARQAETRGLRDSLAEALDKARLSERELAILEARLENGMTLEATALRFGVTRSRIRQIQEKALRKLRITKGLTQ